MDLYVLTEDMITSYDSVQSIYTFSDRSRVRGTEVKGEGPFEINIMVPKSTTSNQIFAIEKYSFSKVIRSQDGYS